MALSHPGGLAGGVANSVWNVLDQCFSNVSVHSNPWGLSLQVKVEPQSAFLTCSRTMPVVLSRVHAQPVREDLGQAVVGSTAETQGAAERPAPRASRSSEEAGC